MTGWVSLSRAGQHFGVESTRVFTSSLTRRTQRLRTVVVLVIGAALLTGCSANSQLSQNASDASAAAQTAALTLHVVTERKTLSGVRDTALSDSMHKLAEDATSLAAIDASGQAKASRDRILQIVRTAQDDVLHAQSILEEDSSKNDLGAIARHLASAASRLSVLAKKLEGQP